MTLRAVIVGLLGAALVASVTYFNDNIMRQTLFIGNHMPHSVYGSLLLFLLIANPAIALLWKRWAFTGAEIAVVLTLTLAACAIPGAGLMRFFTNAVMLPHNKARTQAGWQAEGVVDMLPEYMLAGSPPTFRGDDLIGFAGMCFSLSEAPASGVAPARLRVRELLPAGARALAADVVKAEAVERRRREKILAALDTILLDPQFCKSDCFAGIKLPAEAKELLGRGPALRPGPETVRLNHLVLASAYPKHLAPLSVGPPRAMRPSDVVDWPGWCALLLRDGPAQSRKPSRRLWELLPQDLRPGLAQIVEAGKVTEERRARLAEALNGILDSHKLYSTEIFTDVTLPGEAVRLLRRELKLAAAAAGKEPPDDLSARPDRVIHLDADDVRWLNRHLIDAAWPDAIRSISSRRHEELHSFMFGKDPKGRPVDPTRIPWSAWVRPLLFWLPLVVVLLSGTLALAVVVHKQWSEHEQLPYPVATFALSLLPDNGEAKGGMLRNQAFLATTAIVLGIHALNYANAWWPAYFVRFPMSFDFSSLQGLSPALSGGVAKWAIFTVRIFFIVVGLAFFVPLDVSLSIGLAAPLRFYIMGTLQRYGITFGGRGLYSGSPPQTFRVGAYSGILAMLLYTGRRYYAAVLRKAFGLRATDDVPDEAAWGARVFFVCAAVFVVYLIAAGIPWPLALLYTALAFMLFIVMSRILAETGLFFNEPRWYPCAFLVALFGIRAIGPTTALLMFMMSTILLVIPRESLMPFVVNAFRMLDAREVKVGRTAIWCGAAVLLALAIAVPVTLMFQYGAGTHHWDAWGTGAVPRYAFDKTVEHKQRLRAQGVLEESESAGVLAGVGRITPETPSVIAFVVGLGVVLLLASGRLRFSWWPLHPVLAIAFWSYPGAMFWPSFLIGWAIKRTVIRYGGHRSYRRLTPVMLGLIAGDVLGMLLPALIGALYYLLIGRGAPSFLILPD